MKQNCARAEILAGAIALNEASDVERDEYRLHIAACASCLRALGGEREIERVMATVATARDAEVWDPAPVRAGERRSRSLRVAFAGASALVLGVTVSLGVHFVLAANVKPLTLAKNDVPAFAGTVYRVSLDKRVAPAKEPKPPRHMVVVHNVIALDRTRRSTTPIERTTTTIAADAGVPAPTPPAQPQSSNVPVWRRGESVPVARAPQTVAAAPQDAPPMLAGHAESIAVAPSYVVHDAVPVGGENAINPQPPPIAYAQGAEGTTAFEVSIDDRGAAMKCTITKSSGFLSLDEAVCKAAMKARYAPRTINGKPVPGVYRDAFTFRATNNNDGEI